MVYAEGHLAPEQFVAACQAHIDRDLAGHDHGIVAPDVATASRRLQHFWAVPLNDEREEFWLHTMPVAGGEPISRMFV